MVTVVVAGKSTWKNRDGLELMGAELKTYNVKAAQVLVCGMWTLLDVHAPPAYYCSAPYNRYDRHLFTNTAMRNKSRD